MFHQKPFISFCIKEKHPSINPSIHPYILTNLLIYNISGIVTLADEYSFFAVSQFTDRNL